jgi:hypothetical protein
MAAQQQVGSDCLACHSDQARGPANKNFRINEDAFKTSVHGSLKCTGCHEITTSAKERELPHPKTLPDVDCTLVCHRESVPLRPGESPLYYPDSVHGREYLERGNKEVAKCWNCHGKHNIKKIADPDSAANRKNIPLTCSICHENMAVVIKYNIHRETPYQEYMGSVHGKALFKAGLVSFAAVCTDCHGVHNIQGVADPHRMAKRPETCGKCHVLIFDEYKESLHGKEALKGNVDAPLCVDCHGEHGITSPLNKAAPTSAGKIPDTCSKCHARPEIMQKYGIPSDRIKSFIESLHGIAIGFGDRAAANCTSCHGFHGIVPASDPRSPVNPANLAKTCGQSGCHPGMPAKIKNSKIHFSSGQKSSGIAYYVQKILLWTVFVLAVLTILWFVPGFIRKLRLVKKK